MMAMRAQISHEYEDPPGRFTLRVWHEGLSVHVPGVTYEHAAQLLQDWVADWLRVTRDQRLLTPVLVGVDAQVHGAGPPP
jgi:hypothetical protein